MKKIIFVLFVALAAAGARAEAQINFEQMPDSDMSGKAQYLIRGGPFDGRYLYTFSNKAGIAKQIAQDISKNMETANLEPADLFDQNSVDRFQKAQTTRCLKMADGKITPRFFYLFNIGLSDDAGGSGKRGLVFRVTDTAVKGFMDKKCQIIDIKKADMNTIGLMFAGDQTGNIIIL